MSRIVAFIAFLFSAGILIAGSNDLIPDKSSAIDINITGTIFQTDHGDDYLSRITQMFSQELELKNNYWPINMNIYPADGANREVLSDSAGVQYYIEAEIIKHEWKVSRSFQIPFIFFVYHNSFNLQAVFRIYQPGNQHPVFLKKYRVTSSGPRVMQMFENNPHDGGLMVDHGRRQELESKAENKLVKKMINDLYRNLIGQGG
jgi:hypothetical protein